VIEMVEIGAGGGSIATVDQLKRLKVGPGKRRRRARTASYGRGRHGARPSPTPTSCWAASMRSRFAGGSFSLDSTPRQAALERGVGQKLGLAGHPFRLWRQRDGRREHGQRRAGARHRARQDAWATAR
jgi:N-methylhydantoinase A